MRSEISRPGIANRAMASGVEVVSAAATTNPPMTIANVAPPTKPRSRLKYVAATAPKAASTQRHAFAHQSAIRSRQISRRLLVEVMPGPVPRCDSVQYRRCGASVERRLDPGTLDVSASQRSGETPLDRADDSNCLSNSHATSSLGPQPERNSNLRVIQPDDASGAGHALNDRLNDVLLAPARVPGRGEHLAVSVEGSEQLEEQHRALALPALGAIRAVTDA